MHVRRRPLLVCLQAAGHGHHVTAVEGGHTMPGTMYQVMNLKVPTEVGAFKDSSVLKPVSFL